MMLMLILLWMVCTCYCFHFFPSPYRLWLCFRPEHIFWYHHWPHHRPYHWVLHIIQDNDQKCCRLGSASYSSPTSVVFYLHVLVSLCGTSLLQRITGRKYLIWNYSEWSVYHFTGCSQSSCKIGMYRSPETGSQGSEICFPGCKLGLCS